MTRLIILLDTIQKTDTNLENEVQKRMIWTCISNPVEYLRQSFFAKIVNG